MHSTDYAHLDQLLHPLALDVALGNEVVVPVRILDTDRVERLLDVVQRFGFDLGRSCGRRCDVSIV